MELRRPAAKHQYSPTDSLSLSGAGVPGRTDVLCGGLFANRFPGHRRRLAQRDRWPADEPPAASIELASCGTRAGAEHDRNRVHGKDERDQIKTHSKWPTTGPPDKTEAAWIDKARLDWI